MISLSHAKYVFRRHLDAGGPPEKIEYIVVTHLFQQQAVFVAVMTHEPFFFPNTTIETLIGAVRNPTKVADLPTDV